MAKPAYEIKQLEPSNFDSRLVERHLEGERDREREERVLKLMSTHKLEREEPLSKGGKYPSGAPIRGNFNIL